MKGKIVTWGFWLGRVTVCCRRSVRRRVWLAVVVLATAGGLAAPVPVVGRAELARHEATPVASPGTLADPALCTVEPRMLAEILALAAEPPGTLQQFALGTPSAELVTPTPLPSGGGIPADQAVVKAITETSIQLAACLNDADFLRASAVMSDDFLRRGFGGLEREGLASLATPVVIPEVDRAKVPLIEDVRVLPDGRVTAVTRYDDGVAIGVFVREAGRYRLDHSYVLAEMGTPVP